MQSQHDLGPPAWKEPTKTLARRGGRMAVAVSLPRRWERRGSAVRRPAAGPGSAVVGDPCVVWDEEDGLWRMFLVLDPPGHGQAVCDDRAGDPTAWRIAGPLRFTNPEALIGGRTHKPFVVMDPRRPGQAARPGGRYYLLTVSGTAHKLVQRAWSQRLAGPWTVEPGPLIGPGAEADFDGRHADAVSGYFFSERDEFLYFYMGYPLRAQPRRSSPYGSAQGIALQPLNEPLARKAGVILPPHPEPGHWGAGWVGGLQLLPGREHRWVGVVNASPTPPDPADTTVSREEPPPSLGGFALCDQEWPIAGWRWTDEPIEGIADIPADARAAGERDNLWRHHALVLPDGTLALYYNSGAYGLEQIYVKVGH